MRPIAPACTHTHEDAQAVIGLSRWTSSPPPLLSLTSTCMPGGHKPGHRTDGRTHTLGFYS